jgi:hypothetical protein
MLPFRVLLFASLTCICLLRIMAEPTDLSEITVLRGLRPGNAERSDGDIVGDASAAVKCCLQRLRYDGRTGCKAK